jgi:DNA repair exonuclease SbcCD ATPase subunit
VGEDPVEVDFRPGLHVITGENKDKQDRRNGVGKSTIADAIHFAIFGNTIRELKKDNIVNNIICKDCRVELLFNIEHDDNITEYQIIRSLEPSRCKLLINNIDNTRDSIANTTNYICKVLDTTEEIFQNCVILTVNNTVPFMAKKKVDKRKFIEGVFGLEIFSQMLSHVRQDYNEVKRDFEVEATRYEESEKNIKQLRLQRDRIIGESDAKKEKYEKRQKNNTNELEKLSAKVFNSTEKDLEKVNESISSIEAGIELCNGKLNKITGKIAGYEKDIAHKNETSDKIGTSKEKCPVCLQAVTDHDRAHIDDEKKKIQEDICKIKTNIEDGKINIDNVTTTKSKLKEYHSSQINLRNDHLLKVQENKNDKSRIKQLDEWNIQLVQDLSSIKNETTHLDNDIKAAEERLASLKHKIDEIRHKISILDAIKFIVSEEGVKSYIVRKILQLFNNKIMHYLQKMDANCCCIFNEYFEEEIVDEKGKMCSYFNFSGAERKNIDLACLFAFMDIRRLQGNVSYNFSVYDELLDSSLDERGVDLVLDILRHRVESMNECAMVISHRKESTTIGSHYKNPGEVIYLEKKNGITRRVEYTG